MSSAYVAAKRGRAAPEWALLLAVFVVGFLLVASRRPDALLNPQFASQDGFNWYGEAHELGGLRALFLPYRGYLVFVQRLAGWLALGVPLRWAPLVMNVAAVAVQALPAVLLASRRFARLAPALPARLLLAFLYLALPNTWTCNAVITNSQWYLGVLGVLIVLAEPSGRAGWRAFDACGAALSGLSGPFAIFLAPVAGLKWWARRDRWTLVLLAIAAATALVQVAVILATAKGIGQQTLGASAFSFLDLWTRKVVYGALFGQTGYAAMVDGGSGVWLRPWAVVAVGLCGLAAVLYAEARGPLELRLFILYAALAYAASLFWPSPGLFDVPFWVRLLPPAEDGSRYFMFPMLALLASLVWALGARAVPLRAAAAACLAVAIAFGVRLDWREPALRDFNFPAYAERYERAAAGEKVMIPHPPGWSMVLTKK